MESVLQTWKPICGDFLLPKNQLSINIDHDSIGDRRKPSRRRVARIHD